MARHCGRVTAGRLFKRQLVYVDSVYLQPYESVKSLWGDSLLLCIGASGKRLRDDSPWLWSVTDLEILFCLIFQQAKLLSLRHIPRSSPVTSAVVGLPILAVLFFSCTAVFAQSLGFLPAWIWLPLSFFGLVLLPFHSLSTLNVFRWYWCWVCALTLLECSSWFYPVFGLPVRGTTIWSAAEYFPLVPAYHPRVLTRTVWQYGCFGRGLAVLRYGLWRIQTVMLGLYQYSLTFLSLSLLCRVCSAFMWARRLCHLAMMLSQPLGSCDPLYWNLVWYSFFIVQDCVLLHFDYSEGSRLSRL